MFESGDNCFSYSDEEVHLYISFLFSPGEYCLAMTIICLLEDEGNSSEPERPFQCYLPTQSSEMMTALKAVFGDS